MEKPPSDENPLLHHDMRQLGGLLKETLTPHLTQAGDLRILNLACGRCDEAETLIHTGRELAGEKAAVEMVGADIRIREIRQARERHATLPAEFLIEDASQISRNRELGDNFGLVFLRHQNFWHGRDLWTRIFDQGIAKLRGDGLLVITSYFDVEHRLALEALQKLGMEVVESRRNRASRRLGDAPGKSVDRWIAVLRPKGTSS
ncbi:MAG: hypothetical protein KDK99_15975 [Verrucomicrobiales bacterium]|nr:hypothetical protein [Verrucomicrobiales bacterium]